MISTPALDHEPLDPEPFDPNWIDAGLTPKDVGTVVFVRMKDGTTQPWLKAQCGRGGWVLFDDSYSDDDCIQEEYDTEINIRGRNGK